MAKFKKYFELIMWIVGIITSLAIGGFFISGGFMNVMILKLLPLIIHQIVGWIIIIAAAIGLIQSILKLAK